MGGFERRQAYTRGVRLHAEQRDYDAAMQLMEKNKRFRRFKELQMVFIDLEKTHGRVP